MRRTNKEEMKTFKQIKKWCRDHIASSLIATAIFSWFVGWGLSWLVPSPSVAVSNFPQKELTCTLNAGFPLFLKFTKDDDFQILFKEEEIKEPWIYNITIENTGEQPILNEDFIKPLTIDFEESISVIKVSIIESTNRDLWDEFLENTSIQGTIVSIEDLLLNQGESITINIVTEGAAGNIRYAQRTVGLPQLTLKNTVQESKNQPEIIFVVVAIGCFAALLVGLIIVMWSSRKTYLKFKKEMLEYSLKYETLSMEETENESECECK